MRRPWPAVLFLAWSVVVSVARAEPAAIVPGGQFPIAVWLQSADNAASYRAAGINLYVGLSGETNAANLAALDRAGVKLVTEQTPATLAFKGSPVIAGWMHDDEPDNAQSLPKEEGGGYGPPVTPEAVSKSYRRMKAADPSRPVLLNLGMGVAWDGWIGRGTRTNHPEDYPKYVQSADVASFDIYPVTLDNPEAGGKLEYVGRGVRRLAQWAGPGRPVWNCIECTHINNAARKPTPAQVRAEVWMSIINGSRGLIYFCHQFAPTFREPALLDDPEMLAAVTAINAQVQALAPVLLSPPPERTDGAATTRPDGSRAAGPLAATVRRHGGSVYVFVANESAEVHRDTFTVARASADGSVEVLGENRSLPLGPGGSFDDSFEPYSVHLYRIKE